MTGWTDEEVISHIDNGFTGSKDQLAIAASSKPVYLQAFRRLYISSSHWRAY
eukprot:m.25677 g.25677  ORF g.25677 m.25677 type:complete len:52 (-) comp11618_c0_seq2:488-643(-)